MKPLLSFANSKLKKDGIASWSLPAGKTCPMADECLNGCYAMQGFYNMPTVKRAYLNNFLLTRDSRFHERMNESIKRQSPKIVRIHASGDFYNLAYFRQWCQIVKDNPNVQFYAYTKMVLMVKKESQRLIQLGQGLPKNLTIIFSEGGKQDALISPNNDRHSRVFDSLESLKAAGYANVTSHDTGAIGPNHKIGLVYHGAKSKQWTTN